MYNIYSINKTFIYNTHTTVSITHASIRYSFTSPSMRGMVQGLFFFSTQYVVIMMQVK